MKEKYSISGMTCEGCKSHVENTLRQVPGVTEVQVDLKQGEAEITSSTEVDLATLEAAMSSSHYGIHPLGEIIPDKKKV
ncbi:MAG TPA: heavy metal-associated domain-containing protein [Saprospiraceae bacterium]|nr:heavy metal-associated domain-containing protein [Saprospiraceae bacterium]HQW55891.1 heavy metal-associated domain-containing protein [Saprospiraceae bacterium]